MPVILSTPEDVPHPASRHRHAVRELLVEPQQPHRELAEIREPEIGCDHGGDARHVGGVSDVVKRIRHLHPSP
jgi:hypothetical protein